MKISRLVGFILITSLLGLTGVVYAKKLNVITSNHTSKKWEASECSQNCVSFTLRPNMTVSKMVPEVSSGTAVLRANFSLVTSSMTVSSGTVISCESAYNVATTSVAYVNVISSATSGGCYITK